MSWLFSQALGAEFLQATCSDGEPFAPLNVMPTPHKFWRNDKTMEPSDLSRFGLTCAVLTADRGTELLTWFRGASLARTSALPEKAPALKASDPACGPTWRGSLARFDPDSATWRTAQPSLLEDLEESSVTWPRSGMTVGGQCWELPMLALPTSGTGSGLWVPTPCATDAKPITGGNLYVTETGTVRHMRSDGKSSNRGLAASAAMWPTPTVCGNYNRKGASATSGDGLATAVRMWPTPICRDSRTVRGGARMTNSLGTEPLITQVAIAEGATDGALNPEWVEWLMGWPIGWTDLKPLGTGKSPSVLQQHGECSPQALRAEAAC